MVSKGWASALLLLLLSLSGCSDDDGGDGDGADPSTTSTSASTTSATATTTSRSSTTTSSASNTTTSSTNTTTTGPGGNATGNQTGNQTAGASQHAENGDLMAANACQGFFFSDLDNIAQLSFDVDPATYGLSYTATVAGDGIAGIRVGFFDGDGNNVGGVEFEPPGGALTYTDAVPDGAVSATVVGCGAGPYSAVYDAGAAPAA